MDTTEKVESIDSIDSAGSIKNFAQFLEMDCQLRDSALLMFGTLHEDEALDTERFRDAVYVSSLLTGGTAAIDRAIAEETDPSWIDGRLRSLSDFLCSWRERTLTGKLPVTVPLMPETAPGEVYLDALIDALVSESMFAQSAGKAWNIDGSLGEYNEPRSELDWLNEVDTIARWTRWELCALISLSTHDAVGRCQEVVGGILAEARRAMTYREIADRVFDWPSIAGIWERLTELGFDGQSLAVKSEVLKRALRRLLDVGGVETRARGKVSFWRLTPDTNATE